MLRHKLLEENVKSTKEKRKAEEENKKNNAAIALNAEDSFSYRRERLRSSSSNHRILFFNASETLTK